MKKILFPFLLFLFGVQALQARIYVPIDQPADKKLPIAITRLLDYGGAGKEAKIIREVLLNDLKISAYFDFIPEGAFIETVDSKAITAETIHFDQWRAIEAQALVKGSIRQNNKQITVELRLFDPYLKQMLVGKIYRGSVKNVRYMAHRFADEVMLALTGLRGPFNSKITYTANMGRGRKAIYVMDYDGYSSYRITQKKTISLGSKFSPDGSRIVFSSYASGTPEIYIATLGGNIRRLTYNKKTNITPAFTPHGSAVLFSSSVDGEPNLYLMSLSGQMFRRITNSPGIDISPVYSPDGSQIVFSSERAGNLHVFTMGSNGGEVKRLTFVGRYNDTPVWSPDGKKIAFCSQDEGAFDIFIMNPDGSFIQRLTAGEGNNTHPSWSPDSRYLAFASTRSGGDSVYIMRFDGENPTKVSPGSGLLPWWGPSLR